MRGAWNYMFTSVGAKLTDLLAIDLFHHRDLQAIKAFLLRLKALGFRPQSVTTDLLLGYEAEVREVFPDCTYSQCGLHAGRDARHILRQSPPDDGEEGWKRRLTRTICMLFGSKKLKQVKKRCARVMQLKQQAPEAARSGFKWWRSTIPNSAKPLSEKTTPKPPIPWNERLASLRNATSTCSFRATCSDSSPCRYCRNSVIWLPMRSLPWVCNCRISRRCQRCP
jgi:transposase-like protein